MKSYIILTRGGFCFLQKKLDIIFLNPEKGGIQLPKSEKKFHKETTVITPGIDVNNKKDNIGKNKTKTTVFNDEETRNI